MREIVPSGRRRPAGGSTGACGSTLGLGAGYTGQLVEHGPDVQDALERGHRGEQGESVDGDREQRHPAELDAGEHDPDRQDHHTRRSLREPDLALDAEGLRARARVAHHERPDRKSTRLNSSHTVISYAVFCLKKKKKKTDEKKLQKKKKKYKKK